MNRNEYVQGMIRKEYVQEMNRKEYVQGEDRNDVMYQTMSRVWNNKSNENYTINREGQKSTVQNLLV